MKRLLIILLLLPTLSWAQDFTVDQTPLGTDSLWLNYINSTASAFVISASGATGVIVRQDGGGDCTFQGGEC